MIGLSLSQRHIPVQQNNWIIAKDAVVINRIPSVAQKLFLFLTYTFWQPKKLLDSKVFKSDQN
jgi:hypothetical protein